MRRSLRREEEAERELQAGSWEGNLQPRAPEWRSLLPRYPLLLRHFSLHAQLSAACWRYSRRVINSSPSAWSFWWVRSAMLCGKSRTKAQGRISEAKRMQVSLRFNCSHSQTRQVKQHKTRTPETRHNITNDNEPAGNQGNQGTYTAQKNKGNT
ncbi:hypothetical protein GOODEAATRI_018856 [Goodea atripinnis]|uniref:Uncharacterized protein n=1 Tax=Goodea atripinnis TaxID=208336 RepID=A0ABV0N2K2_9TELE